MSDRIANIILLAEDQEQLNLVRQYLDLAGRARRDIRAIPLPGSKGCGSQYVRDQFSKQVAECRGRLGRKTKSMLIVMTDADDLSVDKRENSLENALILDQQTSISPEDPIIILIPKWQVETWIKCLLGQSMLEDDSKSDEPRVTRAEISKAAKVLYAWTRLNATVGETCVPSLKSSLPRWKRIDLRKSGS